MKLINQFCLLLGISSCVVACQPQEELERTLVAEEYTIAENFYHEMQLFADGFLINDTVFNKTSNIASISCDAEITIEVDSSKEGSGRVIMDFDAGQGTCDDGKERSGKLQFEFSERFSNPGAELLVTPINYFVNGYSIEGAMNIVNQLPDSTGAKHYIITVEESRIENEVLDIIFYWSCNYTKLQTSGQGTISLQDDVIQVTGTASGRASNSDQFNAVITSPLLYEFCDYITNGEIDVNRSGSKNFKINYGVGGCDNKASMIIDGKGYPFTLR